MTPYYNGDDELPAVAGSCRHLKYKSSPGMAGEAYGRISCSMCSNWDGTDCRKRVFNSLVSRYGYI